MAFRGNGAPLILCMCPFGATYHHISGTKCEISQFINLSCRYIQIRLYKVNFLETAEEPFRLITSAVPGNTSSQDLMDLSQDFIHMNALDCEKMEINDEDRVILESKYGRVIGIVKIDNSVPEGVIWTRRSAIMLDGFINDLITDEKQQINGGNCLNSTRVRVSKVR
jgi:anaerobic selenocysteine-containing dehydrogenase